MDEIQEYIAEIQEEADLLCSELGNMTRKDANISNEKINRMLPAKPDSTNLLVF